MNVEEIYIQYIKPLTFKEQLQLLDLIKQETQKQPPEQSSTQRSLLELEGLGREIWQGTEAQQYVNNLRKE